MNAISPATRAGAVTPSDTTALRFKRLYVGGAGNVKVQLQGSDSQVTFIAVPAGTFLDVAGDLVMAATTATNIVWMYWEG